MFVHHGGPDARDTAATRDALSPVPAANVDQDHPTLLCAEGTASPRSHVDFAETASGSRRSLEMPSLSWDDLLYFVAFAQRSSWTDAIGKARIEPEIERMLIEMVFALPDSPTRLDAVRTVTASDAA